MKSNETVKHLLRYSALGAVVYISFRFFPKSTLTSKQVTLVTFLVIGVYLVIEYLCGSFQKKQEASETSAPQDLLESFAQSDSCPCAPGKQVEGFTAEVTSNTGAVDSNNESRSELAQQLDALLAQKEAERQQAEEKVSASEAAQHREEVANRAQTYHASQGDVSEFDENDKTAKAELIRHQDREIAFLKERIQEMEGVIHQQAQRTTPLQHRMDPYNDPGHGYSTERPDYVRGGSGPLPTRHEDGTVKNDMAYSHTDFNTLLVADNYKTTPEEFGYSFLPPEKWYPTPAHPPVCVTNHRSEVNPMYTQGAPLDVKEWYASTRVTQPDNINVDYVREKMNAGR